MTDFAWAVVQMERTVSDGGVIVAHWRCNALDDSYAASSYGTCGFTPDPESPDYIPYDQLTESDVLGWCWADGVDKDQIETNLQKNIDEQKNPVTEEGIPW